MVLDSSTPLNLTHDGEEELGSTPVEGGAAPSWLLRRLEGGPGVGEVQVSIGGDPEVVGNGGGGGERDARKGEIAAHPLFEQLFSAHVGCLRIAVPVDQLPRIDAQLAQSRGVAGKHAVVLSGAGGGEGQAIGDELDHFMEDTIGRVPGLVEMFELTHTKKSGSFISDDAKTLIVDAKDKLANCSETSQSSREDVIAMESKIYIKVIRKEYGGRVGALGLIPSESCVCYNSESTEEVQKLRKEVQKNKKLVS